MRPFICEMGEIIENENIRQENGFKNFNMECLFFIQLSLNFELTGGMVKF